LGAAERAVAAAREVGDDWTLADALVIESRALRMLDRGSAADRALGEAVPLAEATGYLTVLRIALQDLC
jgi:hypothetical protein